MAAEHLLSDNRLSEAARILGVWILSQEPDEDGWVEVRFDEVRGLLYGFPSDETIGKHLRMLRGAKWVERRPGGRGHADRYRIIAPTERRPNEIGPDSGRPILSIAPTERRPKPFSPDRETAYEGVGGEVDGDVDEEEVDGARAPAVTDRASRALETHDGKLSGCRSALRDYLASRVPPNRQSAYVHLVATWLDDPAAAFKRPDGTTIADHDEQVKLLAAALNDLGASDESKMRRPRGDPANLRTKLDIEIQKRYDDHPKKRRRNGRAASTNSRGAPGAPRGEAQRGGDDERRRPAIEYGSG